jgi:hypothetical protein
MSISDWTFLLCNGIRQKRQHEYQENHVREDGLDTTLETIVKGTLSTTTSKDLSLDDHIISA